VLEAGGAQHEQVGGALPGLVAQRLCRMPDPGDPREGHARRAGMRLGGCLERPDVGPVDELGPRPGGHFPDRDADDRPAGQGRQVQRRVEREAPERRAVEPHQDPLQPPETPRRLPLVAHQEDRAGCQPGQAVGRAPDEPIEDPPVSPAAEDQEVVPALAHDPEDGVDLGPLPDQRVDLEPLDQGEVARVLREGVEVRGDGGPRRFHLADRGRVARQRLFHGDRRQLRAARLRELDPQAERGLGAARPVVRDQQAAEHRVTPLAAHPAAPRVARADARRVGSRRHHRRARGPWAPLRTEGGGLRVPTAAIPRLASSPKRQGLPPGGALWAT